MLQRRELCREVKWETSLSLASVWAALKSCAVLFDCSTNLSEKQHEAPKDFRSKSNFVAADQVAVWTR
eukprot:3880923-Amphidinium_carterae.1